MKQFTLTIVFLVFCSLIFSQENSNINTEKNISAYKKTGPAARPNLMAPSNRYLGKEDQIKKMMVDGRIPKTFPAYNEKTRTKEEYEKAVMDWFTSHRELVKPEYHQQTTNKLSLFKD